MTACGNNNTTTKDTKTVKPSKEENKVVATVDGTKIPIEDYDKNLEFISYYASAQQSMKYPIIDMLIEKQVIEDDIKKNDIKVSKEEIDDSYKQTIESLGGQKEYDKMLKDYNISDDFIKEEAKHKANYQAHEKWFMENNKVSDDEINEYYKEHKNDLDEVKAKHILLDDETTAKEVKKKIDEGQDWDKLAKEYSKDSYNADKGGDLGSFKRQDMDQRFSDKAFSMKEGEISDPVESSFGWHIIKVEKTKNDVSAVKEDVKKEINQNKYNDYIKKLRERAKIDIEDKDTKEAIDQIQKENIPESND